MKVVFDGTDYDIKPLTISQYQTIMDNPNISDVDIISLFTDIPREEIQQAGFADVKFVAQSLRGDWAGLDSDLPLNLTYTFEGKHYGVIQPSKISFEEWINLEVFFAQNPLNLPLLASHFYKPLSSNKQGEDRELEKYSLSECMSRASEFGRFPIKVFLPALFFFVSFLQELTQNTLLSSETNPTEKQRRNNTPIEPLKK
jgi:hypothetical protein